MEHDLSRSTTKLREQSTYLRTHASVCVCTRTCTLETMQGNLYLMYVYTIKTITCKYLFNFCSATKLQNPTGCNFHVCQPISTTARMYVHVFMHMTIQIPGQSPALCTLIPLGKEYDGTQLKDAGHITLPSPGTLNSAMEKTA